MRTSRFLGSGTCRAASIGLILAYAFVCRADAAEQGALPSPRTEVRGRLPGEEFVAYAQSVEDFRLRPGFASFLLPPIQGLRRASLSHSLLHEVALADGHSTADSGLRTSIVAVLRSSDALRAGLHDANAARYGVGIARAAMLPTLNASVSLDQSRISTGAISSSVNGLQSNSRLDLRLPIFSGGKNYYGLKSARQTALAADQDYLALEQQTAYEGVLAYLDIYLARKSEEALRRNVTALRQINIGMQAQFNAGYVGKTDLAIAASELGVLEETLAEAVANRRDTETVFESKTQLPAPVLVVKPRVRQLVPRTLQQALSEGLTRNARILAADYTAEAARFDAKSVRGRYLPQVDLVGGYEDNRYFDTNNRNSGEWKVGIKVSVPLVDFSTLPTIGQSRENALSARYRARDTARAVEREIRKTWISYQSGLKRAQILERNIGHLKTAVDGTRKEFEIGLRPISDVLRAQMDLTNARIRLAESEAGYASAAYLLKITSSNFRLASLVQ